MIKNNNNNLMNKNYKMILFQSKSKIMSSKIQKIKIIQFIK